MNVQIVGTLLDPSGGEPASGAMIQFIALSQYGGVPKGSQSIETTNELGEYDFPLNYGRYSLAINHSGRFVNQSLSVTVNDESPSVMDIDLLLQSSVPLTPSEIKYVEELTEQAEQAVVDATNQFSLAEGEAVKATNQASIATNEANRAKTEADRASEVTGLDTVEQAVDLALSEYELPIELAGGMVINRRDAHGNLNVMVKIPAFTNKMVNDKLGTNWLPEEALHPGFIGAGGANKTHFEIAMYTASNDGAGNPVSAPYKPPYTSVDWDDAKSKCQSMGAGWDLSGNAQWAAAAIWCLMNGFQPLGNTYYGQSHAESWQSAVRQDGGIPGDTSGTASILSGSGPLSWRHNNSPLGIADLVGNVWEWQDGLKISEGQLIVALEQQATEAEWVAQAAFLDDGNKLNSSKTASTVTSADWRAIGKDVSYVENQLLQQLLIEPTAGTDVAIGRLYYNNDGDRFPRRGGNGTGGANAGLGALNLYDERTNAYSSFGFRMCYFGD